jgi:hypothetical protein
LPVDRSVDAMYPCPGSAQAVLHEYAGAAPRRSCSTVNICVPVDLPSCSYRCSLHASSLGILANLYCALHHDGPMLWRSRCCRAWTCMPTPSVLVPPPRSDRTSQHLLLLWLDTCIQQLQCCRRHLTRSHLLVLLSGSPLERTFYHATIIDHCSCTCREEREYMQRLHLQVHRELMQLQPMRKNQAEKQAVLAVVSMALCWRCSGHCTLSRG